jgi:hypothetical protein
LDRGVLNILVLKDNDASKEGEAQKFVVANIVDVVDATEVEKCFSEVDDAPCPAVTATTTPTPRPTTIRRMLLKLRALQLGWLDQKIETRKETIIFPIMEISIQKVKKQKLSFL